MSEETLPLDTAVIMGQAAVLYEQIRRDRDAAKVKEDHLQKDLAEARDLISSLQMKAELLELENLQLNNNLETALSQIQEYRDLLEGIKARLDYFGIERKKPKVKKEKVICEPTALPEMPALQAPSPSFP